MKLPTDQEGVQPIIDYLGHQPMRPKEEIARAMAELGFKIPIIFDSLDDAVGSGEHFLARSEGPDELYHSGLKTTFDSSDKGAKERIAELVGVLEDPDRTYRSITEGEVPGRGGFIVSSFWYRHIQKHADPTADIAFKDDEFARGHGLSFWKKIEGDNIFIVADNARANRYYIGRMNRGDRAFTVIQNGKVELFSSWDETDRLPEYEKLVRYYDEVRSAEIFDTDNAAILELVDSGDDEEPYFLQYLPAQPKVRADYHIAADQDDVLFVRGATSKDGIRTRLFYGHSDMNKFYGSDSIATTVTSGMHVEQGEYILPRAEVLVMPPSSDWVKDTPENCLRRYGLASVDHGLRSSIFKPKVTVALSAAVWELLKSYGDLNREGVKVLVRSDGERFEGYAGLNISGQQTKVPLHSVDLLHV